MKYSNNKTYQTKKSVKVKNKCQICKKVYKNHSGLYYHKLIHRNNKKFKCLVCDRNFLTLWLLNRHTRSNKQHKHRLDS